MRIASIRPCCCELAGAWKQMAADRGVRSAVLRGVGERVFWSGMEMRAMIPAAQRLARGERLGEEEFEGLRSAHTAVLARFDLGKSLGRLFRKAEDAREAQCAFVEKRPPVFRGR